MHFIHEVIMEEKPDRIEILGDLFHTHNIVRLEVLEFWNGWIDTLLASETPLYILIGNHDIGDTSEHAFSALDMFMRVRNKHLHIVKHPFVEGLYAYVSYYHDPKVFIDVANRCYAQGARVLVCHQTFDGSHYENGFYAPDGIDASKIFFDLIVSGHIHTTQDFQKDGKRIVYPGTPKWDTEADANLKKGIWIFEHDDKTGAIISMELRSTAHVVTEIVHLAWVEGMDLPAIPTGPRVTVNLIGTSKWVEAQKVILKGSVAITAQMTDRVDRKVRQVGKSFPEFVAKKFETNVDKIALLKYMKGLKIV
jgi:DNA repair exonuclease SbcCD nuclease subunit